MSRGLTYGLEEWDDDADPQGDDDIRARHSAIVRLLEAAAARRAGKEKE